MNIARVFSDDPYNANFKPELVIDGNLSTNSRWSSQGQERSVTLDLGESSVVNRLKTAWYKADEGQAFFDVQLSLDNANWTTSLSAATASGTEGLIGFDINNTPARYVRLIGKGNSSNDWNSLIEVDVFGCGSIDTGSPITAPNTEPEPEENQVNPTKATSYDITAVDASHFQGSNLPSNAIDKLTEDGSLWSAEGRTNTWLELDLGTSRLVNTVDIFFLKSDERNTCFNIETSDDGSSWTTQRANIVSNGERLFSFPETRARYVRYYGLGNSETAWNSIIEVEAQWLPINGNEDISDGSGGCPSYISGGTDAGNDTPVDEGQSGTFFPGNTDGVKPPGENFDLTYWKITYPDASESYPPAVVANEFYTDPDTGAMVFECVNRGKQTSSFTKYARSELREMLRGTNTSIGTKFLGNNWVISTASSSDQRAAGGVNGNMKVTVAVDAVSTTYSDGNDFMLGRVIVGQIHGSNDEPFKIFYRKLPGNSKGSVYFSYEDSKIENYYELFGSRDTDASNPADGIAPVSYTHLTLPTICSV